MADGSQGALQWFRLLSLCAGVSASGLGHGHGTRGGAETKGRGRGQERRARGLQGRGQARARCGIHAGELGGCRSRPDLAHASGGVVLSHGVGQVAGGSGSGRAAHGGVGREGLVERREKVDHGATFLL